MSWAVIWEAAAERALLGIPSWQTAASVAQAVYRFASTGIGTVERVQTDTSAPDTAGLVTLAFRMSR